MWHVSNNYYINMTGEFGVVYRGHLIDWQGTKPTELVAVKTLKGVCTHTQQYIISVSCFNKL